MNSVRKTVIGIIGPIGSGKDTAAEYVAEKLHVSYFQISAPLKDIVRERGLEPTRENLVTLGRATAREFGAEYLAKILLSKIKDVGVISGMRQLAQIDYLRNNARLILVAVDAEPRIRFQRSKGRGKLGEATTLKSFVEKERAENSAPHVQRLFECMKLADELVANDLDVRSFYRKLDEMLVRNHVKE